MNKIRQIILRIYFTIRTWHPIWFYILNIKGVLMFKKNAPDLNNIQKKILKDLKINGIAVTSLNELFPNEDMLGKLQKYSEFLKTNAKPLSKKTYLRHYWDFDSTINFQNPFVQLAISDEIIDVVNSYMKMWTKLQYYTLSETIPIISGDNPVYSQKWHRDPQEKQMCKVFIYLNDVDKESGPFTYVLKSTVNKKYGNLFPQKTPLGSYPEESLVDKYIEKNDIKECVGPAGIVIFCDTTGIHKGGHAKTKKRIMSTFFYPAKTFKEDRRYRVKKDELSANNKNLTPKVKYALFS